jgi:hypothetical protein
MRILASNCFSVDKQPVSIIYLVGKAHQNIICKTGDKPSIELGHFNVQMQI